MNDAGFSILGTFIDTHDVLLTRLYLSEIKDCGFRGVKSGETLDARPDWRPMLPFLIVHKNGTFGQSFDKPSRLGYKRLNRRHLVKREYPTL